MAGFSSAETQLLQLRLPWSRRFPRVAGQSPEQHPEGAGRLAFLGVRWCE